MNYWTKRLTTLLSPSTDTGKCSAALQTSGVKVLLDISPNPVVLAYFKLSHSTSRTRFRDSQVLNILISNLPNFNNLEAYANMLSTLPPAPFPTPQLGAALPLTFQPSVFPTSSAVVIGTNKLAASRTFSFLEAGIGRVIIVGKSRFSFRDPPSGSEYLSSEVGNSASASAAPGDHIEICDELRYRLRHSKGKVVYSPEDDLEQILRETPDLFLVTITDTVATPSTIGIGESSQHASATSFYKPRFRSLDDARRVATLCRSLRLPVNVADHPSLCTFSFPAVHRFPKSDGTASSLQIAVSTNGRGCRLAGRIKRDIAASKPLARGIGQAVENVGILREKAKKRRSSPSSNSQAADYIIRRPTKNVEYSSPKPSEHQSAPSTSKAPRASAADEVEICKEEDDDAVSFLLRGHLNSPVAQSPAISRTNSSASIGRTDLVHVAASNAGTPLTDNSRTSSVRLSNDEEEERLRRIRWVSQVSEYWPAAYLARMTQDDIDRALASYTTSSATQDASASGNGAAQAVNTSDSSAPIQTGTPSANSYGQSTATPGLPVLPRHEVAIGLPQAPPSRRGQILLLGSGPGHPSLLTVAAHQALRQATLILSDKLVPSEILALIPSTTELHIAKKFPGNAENSQNEMMEMALEGAQRGEIVVRLKQGDPFVYGRGGEEVLFFREHGYECTVVPGVSSALAGPLMMGIPVTQRGVAESMVLCTGVGRKGKAVQLPGYVRSRSLVVLMGVARIRQVLEVLTRRNSDVGDVANSGLRDGPAFPPHLPIAIIERASSHDQRMVASTLEGIEEALERSGEQRPPGMMIIGWAVLALEGAGDVSVLDDDEDESLDRARVERWLNGRPYVLKDGLSPEWTALLPAGEGA